MAAAPFWPYERARTLPGGNAGPRLQCTYLVKAASYKTGFVRKSEP